MRLLSLLLCSLPFLSATTLTTRVPLNTINPNAICNDGTPAVYYINKATVASQQNSWVIGLQGGKACASQGECQLRLNTQSSLTTTNTGATMSAGTGVFDNNAANNPTLYGANMVMLHYCSSDYYTGNGGSTTVTSNTAGQVTMQFWGLHHVLAMMDDLIANQGLTNSANTHIMMIGSSAGGVGLSGVLDQACGKVPSAICKGVLDSGFFQNSTTVLHPTATAITNNAALAFEGIGFADYAKMGFQLWNSQINSLCGTTLSTTPWLCIVAPYNTIYHTQPVFVFMSMYDAHSVAYSGGISPPTTTGNGLTTTANLAFDLAFGAQIFNNTCSLNAGLISNTKDIAYFIPSCSQHTALTNTGTSTTLMINGQSALSSCLNWFNTGVRTTLLDSPYCYCTRGYDCNPTCTVTTTNPAQVAATPSTCTIQAPTSCPASLALSTQIIPPSTTAPTITTTSPTTTSGSGAGGSTNPSTSTTTAPATGSTSSSTNMLPQTTSTPTNIPPITTNSPTYMPPIHSSASHLIPTSLVAIITIVLFI